VSAKRTDTSLTVRNASLLRTLQKTTKAQITGEVFFDEENLASLASLAVKFNLLAVLSRTRGTPPGG
jgi:hypothetical protein